jgi:hypothetical protein
MKQIGKEFVPVMNKNIDLGRGSMVKGGI